MEINIDLFSYFIKFPSRIIQAIMGDPTSNKINVTSTLYRLVVCMLAMACENVFAKTKKD